MTITFEKFKKYENKWVAINQDEEIVASGENIATVQKKAENTEGENIILKFIYPFNSYLAP